MTLLFQNRYRIPSARHSHWDYGANASYFVTICTKNRVHFFGKVIKSGQSQCMHLSEIGQIAHQCWAEIPDHFPFVQLGAFVVMPNHVHGVITINKTDYDDGDGTVQNGDHCDTGTVQNGDHCDTVIVETQDLASLPTQPNNGSSMKTTQPHQHPKKTTNHFGPQSRNLASIIRGYKTGVTKYARRADTNFQWQPRYHDSIIRSYNVFNRVEKYIINNPKNWPMDRFFKK